MEENDNWKIKTLIIGGLIGAAAGVLGAIVLIQRAEQHQERPKLSAGDGVKLGAGLLGVLRLLSDFVEKK
jgi:hypothetical protein